MLFGTVAVLQRFCYLPYPNSQVANQKRDLVWSKVVLPNDELKRGFTNKTEPRNLNLAGVKR